MYRGNELTKFLALLMLVNGVAPVIAPALGLILSFLFGEWFCHFNAIWCVNGVRFIV